MIDRENMYHVLFDKDMNVIDTNEKTRNDYPFLTDAEYMKIPMADGGEGTVQSLVDAEKLSKDAIVLCEHAKEVALPENYGPFELVRQETYSSTIISIYRQLREEE